MDVSDIHDMTKCVTVCIKEKEGDGKLGVDRGEGKEELYMVMK